MKAKLSKDIPHVSQARVVRRTPQAGRGTWGPTTPGKLGLPVAVKYLAGGIHPGRLCAARGARRRDGHQGMSPDRRLASQ